VDAGSIPAASINLIKPNSCHMAQVAANARTTTAPSGGE
jgi:hypothetical protein